MDNKIIQGTLLVGVSLLAMLFIPLLSQDSLNHEEVAWTRNFEEESWVTISNRLNCFLSDPISNLPLIEGIEDLEYWTLIYCSITKKDYLSDVVSKHFSANDIDEVKLDAIFRLLKIYASSTSYERLKPIISRIIDISSTQPEWFARNLLLRDDWRWITRLIIKADIENIIGPRKGLRDILSGLGDNESKNKFIELFVELDTEDKNMIEGFNEFMKDPSANLDKIASVYNICSLMSRHDDIHLDEDKILGPKYNSILVLQSWIRQDTNERKIKVLFHLLNRCDSAYHQEVMISTSIDLFFEHQDLFISALKKEPHWRLIMLNLSFFLYDRDKEFVRSISNLGSSDFEAKMKSQLEFLRRHLNY